MNNLPRLFAATVLAAACFWSGIASAAPPVAGPNVNMVTGTKFPEGDPSLTKQNEESHAVSSRSARHLFGAANDYRQVPVLAAEGLKGGQAWIQLYKSVDGGESWRSTPLGGCPVNSPQCNDPTGLTAALKAKNPNFAADPTVRPGPYGTFFLSLIAGKQGIGGAGGVVAVQRFVDKNNDIQRTTDLRSCTPGSPGCTEVRIPAGCTGGLPACAVSYVRYKPAEDPIVPDKFTILSEGTPGQFNDKPWNAADVPGRPWNAGKTCELLSWTKNRTDVANVAETVPAFSVYVSFAVFVGQDPLNEHPQMHVAVSNDCGNTFGKATKLTPGNLGANSGSNIAIDPLTGAVYVVWRNFDGQSEIYLSKSTDGGKTWSKKPILVASFNPYDQGTTGASFRTLAFPTIAVSVVGNTSRVHVAWSQRKAMPAATPPYACQATDPAECDARVVMSTSLDGGNTWPAATPVDSNFTVQYETKVGGNYQVRSHNRGHQVQPAMTFAAGKLLVTWLDQRLDHTEGVLRCPEGNTCTSVNDLVEFREGVGNLDAACTNGALPPPYGPACNKPEAVFSTYISDGTPGLVRRHTLDVFAAMADPADVPNFASSSARVSQYAFGSTVAGILNPDGTLQPTPGVFPIRQKEVNAPNLPMFANGRAAFLGDYIDAAGQIIVGTGDPTRPYKFNVGGSANGNFTTSGLAPVFHVSFTDNRDVIAPLDGNWATPTCLATKLTTDASGNTTGSTNFSGCATPGYAGNRNQNVYTAVVSENSLAFANANSKLLSASGPRGFVVTLQNLTDTERTYTLTLPAQASGVTAAFNQQMTSTPSSLTVIVQPRSSSTRTVWAQVNNAALARSKVLVQASSSGFSSLLVLNPDPYGVFVTNGDGSASDLAGNDLGNVVLSNAVLTNNALSNNALTNNVLTNNALTNAVLSNVMLTNAVLSNFQLQNLDPSNVALTNNVLTNNALSNVVLTNAVLSNNVLSNVVLSNAVLTNSALNASLTNVDPANVALSNAVLSNNALTNVVLSNNTLGNAMLSNAVLSNAALSNAVLSNAALSNNVLTNNALSNNVLTNNVLTNAPLIDVAGGETAQTAASLRAIEQAGFELVGSPFTSSDLAASEQDFRETSFTVRNRGNTDATLAIKLLLRDAICTGAPTFTCTTPAGYKLQLILRKVALTPSAIPPTGPATTYGSALRIGMTQRNTIISNIGTLPLIDPSDPDLGKFLPDDPRAATLPLAAGEFAYATIRAIGVGGAIPPDPADLLRWGVKTVSANSVTTSGGPLIISTLNFPPNSVTALQDPTLRVRTIGGSGSVSGTAVCTDAEGTDVSTADPPPFDTGPAGYTRHASVACAGAPITVSDDGTSTRTAKLSFTPKYWGEFYVRVSLQDGSVTPQKDQQVLKVVVLPKTPVVTFTASFPTQITYQQTVDLSALVGSAITTTSTSTATFTFAASLSPTNACYVDVIGGHYILHVDRSLTDPTGTGSPSNCVFSASQDGNETFAPITVSSPPITVNRANQTLLFGTAPTGVTYGNGPQAVSSTVSSTTAPPSTSAPNNLSINHTSQTTGTCTASGTSVTIGGAGTCTIAAAQPGNANYNAATPAAVPGPGQTGLTQSFTIAQAKQAITFVGLPPSGVTFGDTGVTVSATSATVLPPSGTAAGPSGIPVVLTSETESVCTIAGNAVTTVAAGTCTIAANQAGNTNYEPAPKVTRSFGIARGKLYVTSSVSPTEIVYGDDVPPGAVTITTGATFTGPSACNVMPFATTQSGVPPAPANAGNHTITSSLTSTLSPSCDAFFTDATLAVTPAPTQFTVPALEFTPLLSPVTITGKLSRTDKPTVFPANAASVVLQKGATTIGPFATTVPGGPDGTFTADAGTVASDTYALTFDYSGSPNFAPSTATSTLRVEGFSAVDGVMSTPRQNHTSTLLPDGNVLVTGGIVDVAGTVTASAELYCVVASGPCTGLDIGEFKAVAVGMATPRWGHSATRLADGNVLIAGGVVDAAYNPTDLTEVYCAVVAGPLCTQALDIGKFKTASPMSTPRQGHTATLLNDNRILITGGYVDAISPDATTTAELYCAAAGVACGVANVFLPTAGGMALGRIAHTATLLGDGTVLVAGGNVGGLSDATAEIYCTALIGPVCTSPTHVGTFRPTPSPMSSARANHASALLPDGRTLVAGGYGAGISPPPTVTADVYCAVVAGSCLVTDLGTFKPVGPLVTGRTSHTFSVLTDGWVLAAGGIDATPAVLDTSELYEPLPTDAFATGASLAAARYGHAATRLLDGRVLLTGGRDFGAVVFDTAELYNGPP